LCSTKSKTYLKYYDFKKIIALHVKLPLVSYLILQHWMNIT